MELRERRAEARITTHILARLRTADGQCHPAVICDISRSGMRLQLRNTSVTRLLPNISRQLEHGPVEAIVEFDLNTASSSEAVAVLCGIAHFSRITPDDCLMGVAFRTFFGNGESKLASYWQTIANCTGVAGPSE